MKSTEAIARRAYWLGVRTMDLRSDERQAVLEVWNRAWGPIAEAGTIEQAEAALDEVEAEIKKWEDR